VWWGLLEKLKVLSCFRCLKWSCRLVKTAIRKGQGLQLAKLGNVADRRVVRGWRRRVKSVNSLKTFKR